MTEEKLTYCRICEVYCGMVATVEDGRVTKLRPDKDHVLSRGYACPKGVTFHQVTHDPDRILHPMKKVNGEWQRISWDAAIGEIAAKLDRIRRQHGPHSIGLYTGNPAGYSYNHRLVSIGWIDAIGSRNTYGAGSQDNLSLFLVSKFLYGRHFLRPVPDLAHTSFLLVVGTNPAVSQGTLMHVVDVEARLEEIRARGGKIVVVDPRRTETARLADEHHFIRPDSDVHLLLAMANVILGEGLEAKEFLRDHTVGLERIREVVRDFTPDDAAAKTGIDADTIRRLAREMAAARGAAAIGRLVVGRFGTLTAWSMELLNVLTGNLGARGGVLFSRGLVDFAGIVAMVGRDEYGEHRSRVSGRAGVLGELPSGVLAEEITEPGEGQIRALVVTAGNPVLSIPNGEALAAAMKTLDLSVALDFYMSETASLADYFLPCATPLERADFPIFHSQLMTEPYAQWTEAVIPPEGEAKEEWEIFALLSDAMGLRFMNDRGAHALRQALKLFGREFSPRWIIDGMIRLGPYGDRWLPWSKGWSLKKLAARPHGVRLPDPEPGDVAKHVKTPDRKVHLWNRHLEGELARLREVEAAEAPREFPFRLIGRRDIRSNNSWLHNVPKLMSGERCHRLRIHPSDAATLGLAEGDRARVRSRVAAVETDVRITDEVMPGVVSLPHGWGHRGATNRRVASGNPGVNCNALMDEKVIEPLAGMSLLNGVPVAVERLSAGTS
jgi:anaerobic selenocysteine-containing dehydrogenase